jgi:hypothetical protein
METAAKRIEPFETRAALLYCGDPIQEVAALEKN